MNKIIWIASYPKSGNTWLRYFLGNYYFNNKDNFEPEIIKNIKKFHLDKELIKSKFHNQDFIKNPYNVSKYWIESQKKLEIKKGNVVFLKTHNALINIENNEFTNSDLTLAIIYIIRDPRDVVVSYSKYRHLDYDKTIEHMIGSKVNIPFVRDAKDASNIEITGSWAFHYNSWKDGISVIPRIIIKYEDLLSNSENIFTNIIKFLSNIMKFEVNYKKIKSSNNLSKFTKLKNFEEKNNFFENNSSENFFRIGKSGNWKKELNKDQIKKIEDSFKIEMINLGYL
tara:strand:- start:27 stop:875 length:849 start_codon:yes stop_codon:yes gene_type:complete